MRDRPLVLTLLVFMLSSFAFTWSQAVSAQNAEDVQKGHALAIKVCSVCHIAAPDQPSKPILTPPAPSFESIVRQKAFDAESLHISWQPHIAVSTIQRECQTLT